MSNKEAYNLLNSKLAFNESNYEHIQAFEIPVSKVYKIRRVFSELVMIHNIQQSYKKLSKVPKSTYTYDNYTQ